MSERLPALFACIGFVVASLAGLAGALELRSAVARRTKAQRYRRAAAQAAAEARMAAARAEEEAATERWRYEHSTARLAQVAHDRGDEYFSTDLKIDSSLADDLNDIVNAGWNQVALSPRRKDGHGGVMQTFVFRRVNR